MDWLLSWLKDERSTLMRAPALVLLLLILGGVSGWISRGMYDDHHILALQDQSNIAAQSLQRCLSLKPSSSQPPITVNVQPPRSSAPSAQWQQFSAAQQKKIDQLEATNIRTIADNKRLKYGLDDCLKGGDMSKTIRSLQNGTF